MIVFIDTEVDPHTKKVADYGAVREDDGEHQSSGAVLHSHSKADFDAFVSECDTVCGHNIINHDLKYTALRGNPPEACRSCDRPPEYYFTRILQTVPSAMRTMFRPRCIWLIRLPSAV